MVSYITINNMPEFDDFLYIKEQLNYVCQHFKNLVVAEFMVDYIISEYITREGIGKLEELAPIYKAKVNTPKKITAFNELCDKWHKIAPGQPSPSFTYKDINGKEVHLSDFVGKYVYIDNWAILVRSLPSGATHVEKTGRKIRREKHLFRECFLRSR